eukprot:CAMPEP_0173382234 /NCGR_PEP_ID=MMETSP1356-20130122/4719_1 /TAXON_ID=77927 ORGANISM="Hemiselmis virescens, Strain PCC157" /NCGR_SAMPLE_ID=MMETSP1356 /ASSEMBLY_ACC=CAM_ASM_000847 /LENGTH=161 /DNA_ID=CAMNT_0014336467 /DNA_START=58 /DNA_END=539 /DNA_ORIENTATION=-
MKGAAMWKMSKVSGYHTACGIGDTATVQDYLAERKSEFIAGKRVTPIHLDPTGASGLSLAASGGHLGCVLAFLQSGKMPPHAGVNGPDLAGVTPLMRAAQGGHTAVMRELLNNQADLKASSKLLGTCLHAAARCKDVHSRDQAYQMLVEAGADESALDAEG